MTDTRWSTRGPQLDVGVYRRLNQDLRHLSDEALEEHFHRHGFREPRTFALVDSAAASVSMRYLRGEGIEIGAGSAPTPLFGDATCIYADVADHTAFDDGVNSVTQRVIFDISSPVDLGRQFDFVIASHVLEHVDSLGQALRAITRLARSGGTVYLALPNLQRDADQLWMPQHGRLHHWLEIWFPGLYRARHERAWCEANADGPPGEDVYSSRFPPELQEAIRQRRLPSAYRYLHHRHSYSFEGWLRILTFLRWWVAPELQLVDARSGDDRSDCHFVFLRH